MNTSGAVQYIENIMSTSGGNQYIGGLNIN